MNCKLLLFSIIETLYIFYMFLIYKSKYNFDNYWFTSNYFRFTNLPLLKKLNAIFNNYFYHKVQHSEIDESFICPFGKDVAKFIIIWLIVRSIIPKLYKKYNLYIVVMAILLCYLNFNAFIYSIPIIIVEYYLYKTL